LDLLDVQHFVNGVKMFQDYLLKNLMSEMTKCEDADVDMERLSKWSDTFKKDADFVAIMAGNLTDAAKF